MLSEFITRNRTEIISRIRTADSALPFTSPSDDIERGVPLFLTQLSETLRLEATDRPFSRDAIGSGAARHGAQLQAGGCSVTQVVNEYGAVCQAITQVAMEQRATISTDEFRILNRSLDTAIGEAVSEHARLVAQRRSAEEVERSGRAAHELRDFLSTAFVAFHSLKHRGVAADDRAGAVLGRSLTNLQSVIDRTLSEVRLAAGTRFVERIPADVFIDEIAAAATLHAEHRNVRFTATRVPPGLAIVGDAQLLASGVMNLVHNALKYTAAGGAIALRAYAEGERLLLEIEDECGGLPTSGGDLFRPFAERRGKDRSGLGLGLSIAREAVGTNGGDITIRNLPGKGCIFTVHIPLAADSAGAPADEPFEIQAAAVQNRTDAACRS